MNIIYIENTPHMATKDVAVLLNMRSLVMWEATWTSILLLLAKSICSLGTPAYISILWLATKCDSVWQLFCKHTPLAITGLSNVVCYILHLVAD